MGCLAVELPFGRARLFRIASHLSLPEKAASALSNTAFPEFHLMLSLLALLGDFLLFVAENHAGALNSKYHREHGEQHREHKLQAVG